MTSETIKTYHAALNSGDKKICSLLADIIKNELPEAEGKIWHAHPVWFINNNPIVGYSKQKAGIRLMFWSGSSFEEDALNIKGKKFKDASVIYLSPEEVNAGDLKRWLQKSKDIQWDYKNLIKNKGVLHRLA